MKSEYLGEVELDTSKDERFKNYTQADYAMKFITRFGGIDGSHHKQWLIDQVARILKGTRVIIKEASWSNGQKEHRLELDDPSQEYIDWVEYMLGDEDEDGFREYTWDEGVAP